MKRRYMRPMTEVVGMNHEVALLDGSLNDHADTKQHDFVWEEEVFEEEMDEED